ncbi:MAG: methyltransferase domain-containing protein [candidate division Zixibacteria bacterium]|nr:methyltransferase domain-containing protein [candidate division Zixibacteria bacterium]
MKITKEELISRLKTEDFPLSNKYDPQWVIDNHMGPNVLWLTEWLCRAMEFQKNQRILDLGCGKAVSSVFLAKEFDINVWASDLWIKPSENWPRICQAGMQNRVFPVYTEAHALPYAAGFFEAIVSLDSYHYYGTDENYLGYILSFVPPGGRIGIVVPGLMRDFKNEVPEYLTRRMPSGSVFWNPAECFSFHTVDWWQKHWEKTGLVEIETADIMYDGWLYWLRWAELLDELGVYFDDEAPALREDRGKYLGFIRLVARKKI